MRRDPYERAYFTSNTYHDWLIDRLYFLDPAQAYVAQFLDTFEGFPPRQKPGSFRLSNVLDTIQNSVCSRFIQCVGLVVAYQARHFALGSRRYDG